MKLEFLGNQVKLFQFYLIKLMILVNQNAINVNNRDP